MNTKVDSKRIYHHYELWEDHKNGFYNNSSGNEFKQKEKKVIELFSDPEKTREYMTRVVNEWKYSCEHNLSNNSMNKIAYLGQAACCLYYNIPNTVTMSTWSKLPEEVRNEADKIAKEVLLIWESKNIQLCLNIF